MYTTLRNVDTTPTSRYNFRVSRGKTRCCVTCDFGGISRVIGSVYIGANTMVSRCFYFLLVRSFFNSCWVLFLMALVQ